MLQAPVTGESNPTVLAELARGRLRAKIPALQQALAGRFRTGHHGLLAAHMRAHIDFLDATLATAAEPFRPIL
jgi:transposase